MPSLTRNIPNDSDVARRILREVKARVMASERKLQTKHKKWREAEERTLAYLPEREVDSLRRTDRENGLPTYTTIQIPYTYAVLMSAHTYLTSVFFSRNPVFQFDGRHGETQQNIQALEAVVGYQTLVGGWLVPLYTWLYDAGKYGAGVVGMYWEERIESITTIQNVPKVDVLGNPIPGQFDKVQTTKPVTTYQGNKLYNIQPWDFLFDTRQTIRDFQKGEYCATRFALGWNDCKRREAAGYYTNLDALKGKRSDYYDSAPGSSMLERPESFNGLDESWVSPDEDASSRHPMLVRGYECYIELIPKEWGLGESTWPEKWVFTCSADFGVLIGAAPLGAIHSKFPFSVLPLEVEAYGLVTRGMPETLEPIQNTIDWLLNSHFYNVRATINNKYVVDPTKVVMKDVLNPLPGGVIRLKPAAYNTDVRTAITQLQTSDITRTNLTDLQMMFGMGERTMGVNDQIMGMLNSGGRKTATEIRTSTSFGVNRLKTTAEWFGVCGFEPLSMMLVQNTQQYYDGEQQYKIAGDLLGSVNSRFVQVTPDLIAGSYDYVPVDGNLPIDRFAQVNLWRELLAQMRNFPQLMFGYDIPRIFEWVAQLGGLKNITQFKLQITPDQQLAMAAQAGNSVPMPGAPGAGSRQTPTSGFPLPKQAGNGMGPAG
jgi:hypothetical protein